MVTYSSQLKHNILLQYCPGNRAHSFSSLVSRYNIRGGKSLIRKWFNRWNGTSSSLNRRGGAGRKVKLNSKQVNLYITKPIRRANQKHVAIHYPELELMKSIHVTIISYPSENYKNLHRPLCNIFFEISQPVELKF